MKNILLIIAFASLFMGGISGKNKTEENTLSLQKENVTNVVEVSAWLPWWKEASAIASIERSQNKLFSIMPVWYTLSANGRLSETPSPKKEEVIQLSKLRGIKMLATVSNADSNDFDPERVSLILKDQSLQDNLINQMILIAKEKGFSGWDIDWEKVKEEDNNLFSKFIESTSAKFHENGLILSVAVHAQTGKKTDWEGVKGQDLQKIARSADKVRIMAYDFHHAGSVPGSVTPVASLEEVLRYSITVIPTDKLVLGLPTYGYDWSENGGKALQYDEMASLVEKYKIEVTRDDMSHSLTGSYQAEGVPRVVWYEDAVSLAEKIKIAENYGIYQISLWHLGGEDPGIWDSLQNVKTTTSD